MTPRKLNKAFALVLIGNMPVTRAAIQSALLSESESLSGLTSRQLAAVARLIEKNYHSAKLCGRMVSLEKAIRHQAAKDVESLLAELPKFLGNSPHYQNKIEAIRTLISRVTD